MHKGALARAFSFARFVVILRSDSDEGSFKYCFKRRSFASLRMTSGSRAANASEGTKAATRLQKRGPGEKL